MTKMILCVVLMAAVSYLPRVIPLLLVKKKITNTFVCSLLTYLPFGLLSAMLFPAIFYSTGHIISAAVGTAVAIAAAFIRRTGLFTVTLLGCISVFITEMILHAVGMM